MWNICSAHSQEVHKNPEDTFSNSEILAPCIYTSVLNLEQNITLIWDFDEGMQNLKIFRIPLSNTNCK